MTKKRLSSFHRARIERYLKEQVETVRFAELQAQAAEAEKKLKELAYDAAKRAYPEADMRVLDRYDLTHDTDTLSFTHAEASNASNASDDFVYVRKMAKDVRVPKGLGTCVIPADDPLFAANEKFTKDRDALRAAVREVVINYRKFLSEAKYFEDVCEVIPDVEHLRSELFPFSVALSCTNEDVMSAIEQDVRERRKLKEKGSGNV